MSQESSTLPPLKVPGMRAVLLAQFFSAFSDNALLFVTLAMLKSEAYPAWSQPLLQMMLVLAFILLAPFVGQCADQFPKGRVMLLANLTKLLGVVVIAIGINPFLGYGLVGIGAAAYSPAKYGILSQLLPAESLVKGNGLMESSTIAAILLGSVAGGLLADWHIPVALLACAIMYVLAVWANGQIPKLVPTQQRNLHHPLAMLRSFIHVTGRLWSDASCRFSLIATSLFWGAGVTLRFLLILWVPMAIGIQNNTLPTTLNAMVALGIVLGAGAAAKFVSLSQAARTLPAGIAVGLLVIIFALQTQLLPAYCLLALVGVCGGFFVVPLNALLQERGRQTIGAGSAIAVQNLGENSMMLLMLLAYSLAIWLGLSVTAAGISFGALFALAVAALWWWQQRHA